MFLQVGLCLLQAEPDSVRRSESYALANLFMDALVSISNFVFTAALSGLKIERIDRTDNFPAKNGTTTILELLHTPLFVFTYSVDKVWAEVIPDRGMVRIYTYATGNYNRHASVTLSTSTGLGVYGYAQNTSTGNYLDSVNATVNIVYLYA